MRRNFTLTVMLLLAGCAVGPKYAPPHVAADPAWVEPVAVDPIDQHWWESFGDPVLVRLITVADADNLDIRAARARLDEARANRDAAAGGRFPQIDATGSATTNRLSENGQIPVGKIPGFSRNFDLYDAGFDASWEVDFWGRAARTVAGAEARADAAEADRRAICVTLRAEVARTYIDLRAAQARLVSMQTDADAQAQIADLTRQRFDAGEASRFDYDRAEGQALATASQMPSVKADIRVAAYRLTLLTGKPPEALDTVLLDPAPIPQAPDRIAMGLRSELLRRRPDITAAERRLAAATSDVGVATAELFPRLTLLGSIGQQARSPGDLADSASTRFQIGPSLHWPVFDFGRIRAGIRGARARAEGAATAYEVAVLGALHESETTANRFAHAGETVRQSTAARDAQQSALSLARQRYRAGEADLIELLTVESAFAAAERAATDAQAARASQAVALYKALGGGV
jgi:NodT family efflux transporter outer membrane factor (OMF) lipoprotein